MRPTRSMAGQGQGVPHQGSCSVTKAAADEARRLTTAQGDDKLVQHREQWEGAKASAILNQNFLERSRKK